MSCFRISEGNLYDFNKGFLYRYAKGSLRHEEQLVPARELRLLAFRDD